MLSLWLTRFKGIRSDFEVCSSSIAVVHVPHREMRCVTVKTFSPDRKPGLMLLVHVCRALGEAKFDGLIVQRVHQTTTKLACHQRVWIWCFLSEKELKVKVVSHIPYITRSSDISMDIYIFISKIILWSFFWMCIWIVPPNWDLESAARVLNLHWFLMHQHGVTHPFLVVIGLRLLLLHIRNGKSRDPANSEKLVVFLSKRPWKRIEQLVFLVWMLTCCILMIVVGVKKPNLYRNCWTCHLTTSFHARSQTNNLRLVVPTRAAAIPSAADPSTPRFDMCEKNSLHELGEMKGTWTFIGSKW